MQEREKIPVSQISQNYCATWGEEIREAYRINKEKVSSDLFYLSSIAASESNVHLQYSIVGFKQFCNAIQRNDWSALPQIVSMSILDIFIMNEQILRTAYIGKFNTMNHDAHDIVECARSIGIYEQLSLESQDHLNQLIRATIWVRYPLNSLNYYRTRCSDAAFPKALLAIENSQLIASGKLQTRKELGQYVDYIFNLFKQQCTTSFEIISLIKGESNESVYKEYIQQIEALHQQALMDLPMVDNLIIPKEVEMGEFEKEILQLRKIADDIQAIVHEFPRNVKTSPVPYLNEAYGHIKNFIETLRLYDVNRDPYNAAWIYRSCFIIQFAFESLYTSRHIVRVGDPIMNHDLVKHHEKMRDSAEMNPSAFSFNKSMQYTSSHACDRDALSSLKILQRLENAMDTSVEVEQELATYFGNKLRKFVENVVLLLTRHTIACQNDIIMKGEKTR